MHSRLPIAVPPAHHETAGSYVQRLATLHGLPLPELWEQVSHPRRPGSTSRLVALDRLAAVTGHHTWPTCPRSSSRSAPTCACCTATAPQPPTMPC